MPRFPILLPLSLAATAAFGPDDDYREIGEVPFPKPAGWGEPEPKLLSRTLTAGRPPVSERTSWTLCSPAKDAAPCPAGLIGPAWIFKRKS